MKSTCTKTQSAQAMGVYKPTAIDTEKAVADFRLLQVGPCVIRWRDGRTETVTRSQLTKLQKTNTWATDF